MVEMNPLGLGLKTGAMLFLVLGCLIFVLYLMKRTLPLRRGKKSDLPITAVSTFHFSSKERIEVIEVSGERVVLGITPGRINFLTKINPVKGKGNAIDGKSDTQTMVRE